MKLITNETMCAFEGLSDRDFLACKYAFRNGGPQFFEVPSTDWTVLALVAVGAAILLIGMGLWIGKRMANKQSATNP